MYQQQPIGSNSPFSPQGYQPPEESLGRAPRRTGVLGWWVDLTAPQRPTGMISITQRERLRKAELTSYIILAVFAFLIALISNSLASPSTAEAVGTMAIGLIIAGVCNRLGATRTAAILVPALLMALIMLSLLGSPGLQLLGLPIYDLFVIPIFISSLTIDRRAPWLFAALAIGFITLDFLVQPHALINAPNAQNFDDLAYQTRFYGIWGMINRHVALNFFAALVSWLGARSADVAILRADQAEEVGALQRVIVEQKREQDYGIDQLILAHTRAANGDYSVRAALSADNALFRVAGSLNNLLGRLQKASQAEFMLRRIEAETSRLVTALDDFNARRRPLWPAPAGTPVDDILKRLPTALGLHPAAGPTGFATGQLPQSAQPNGYTSDGQPFPFLNPGLNPNGAPNPSGPEWGSVPRRPVPYPPRDPAADPWHQAQSPGSGSIYGDDDRSSPPFQWPPEDIGRR